MKKLVFLAAFSASLVQAQTINNWVSSTSDPVRNGYGECWRNSSWTPATAHPACNPDLQPKPKAVEEKVVVAEASPKEQAKKLNPTLGSVAAPPLMKVSLAGDTLFDFDKSVIKPEGRVKLNSLVDQIKGVTLEVIIAVGHTDSIGTDAYNMRLGLRRAEAVKAYLISRGIPANLIKTDSKGERQPVASNNTHLGRAKNRRVEIEVVGTRK